MKTTIFVLFILCTAGAFGQARGGVLSNQAEVLELPEHPQHATFHDMAIEQSLVGGTAANYTYAQGERRCGNLALCPNLSLWVTWPVPTAKRS